jgi:hypothetical protein
MNEALPTLVERMGIDHPERARELRKLGVDVGWLRYLAEIEDERGIEKHLASCGVAWR